MLLLTDINVLIEGVTETIVCPVSQATGVVWSLRAVTERGDTTFLLPTSEDDGSKFQTDGNNLEIRNITGDYEGIYECNNITTRCLLALGRGIFRNCPNDDYDGAGGCSQPTVIGVDVGDNVTLDVRVTFELSGPCRNQAIRTLSLTRVSDNSPLFLCSSLGSQMPLCCEDQNQPSDRVEVAYDPSCASDCKFRISLLMPNFNLSDVGMYVAVVSLNEGNPGDRRIMLKTFDLISPITTTDSTIFTTQSETTDCQPGYSLANNGSSCLPISSVLKEAVAFPVTILIFLIGIIIIIIIVIVVKKKRLQKSFPIYEDLVLYATVYAESHYSEVKLCESDHNYTEIDHPYDTIPDHTGHYDEIRERDDERTNEGVGYVPLADVIPQNVCRPCPTPYMTDILRQAAFDTLRNECSEKHGQVRLFDISRPDDSLYEQIAGYEQVPNPDMTQILANLSGSSHVGHYEVAQTYELISGYERVHYSEMIEEIFSSIQAGEMSTGGLSPLHQPITRSTSVHSEYESIQPYEMIASYERVRYGDGIENMFNAARVGDQTLDSPPREVVQYNTFAELMFSRVPAGDNNDHCDDRQSDCDYDGNC